MSAYESSEQASAVFGRLFAILLDDAEFVARMRERGLSLRLIQTAPDLELYVDADGVRAEPVDRAAAVTIRMRSDTAHALWSGTLLMPVAIATGKIRIKGSVAKVLEMVPLLQPAFDRYPALAREAGIAA